MPFISLTTLKRTRRLLFTLLINTLLLSFAAPTILYPQAASAQTALGGRAVVGGSAQYSFPVTSIPLYVSGSAIAPDGTMYIGVLGSVYKSTDGGNTWTYLSTLVNGKGFAMLHAALNGYLYASQTTTTGGGGIWRSMDGGLTWTMVLTLTGYTNAYIWGFAEDSNGVLYAGLYQGDDSDHGAIIYRSTDNGTTWPVVYTDPTGRHIHALAVDSSNDVYASIGDDIAPWNTWKILKSTDGGTTWNQILSGIPQQVGIAAGPTARVFAGDSNTAWGIWRTTDDSTYSEVLTFPAGFMPSGFWARYDSQTGYYYVGFVASGSNQAATCIYRSINTGITWHPILCLNPYIAYNGFSYAANIVNSKLIVSEDSNNVGFNGVLLDLTKVPVY